MKTYSHGSQQTVWTLLLAVVLMAGAGAQAADTDIVINEIMQNPYVLDDADGEWFELHNTGVDAVSLDGWSITDNNLDSFAFPSGLVIAAGEYVVFARNATALAGEGVTVFCEYSGFILANGEDELWLFNASVVEVDRVDYDGGTVWPDPNGASMMFDEAAADNNVGTNWTASTAVFGSGDFGTPGAANGGVALQAPIVNDVYHRSILPEPAEPVTVYADATDSDGTVTAVDLYVQVNDGGFTSTAMSFVSGNTYSATIAGAADGDTIDYYVEATDNDAQTGTNPSDAPTGFYSYGVAPEAFTDIASVHADSAGYDGQWIMVQGQVYIPGDYKADGVSISAYIQDLAGRGLNIFGTTRSTGGTLLNDTGAIVKVSGRVDYYYATLELVNYEVELVSSGNPDLTETAMTTVAAAALSNEGSYIGATGPITLIETTGGSNPAHNFTIDDGSGPVVIRVDDDIDATMPTWLMGDELVAAGAGGSYDDVGQIIVGLASKLTNNGQGPDEVAPLLSGATLSAATEVTLQFNEAIDATTGNTAGNYEVYETATPANTITVSAAAVQTDATVVVLTLGASASGTAHTVRINNVEDLAGNPIVANTTADIVEPGVVNLVINEVMNNPYVLSDSDGEWFEVYNAGADPVDMNGWTIRDAGANTHVIDNGGPLVIGAGEYQVFGISADSLAVQGVTLFYEYSSIFLGNTDDEIFLVDLSAAIIDSVVWDGGPVWPDLNGISMQFTGVGDNNDGANWTSNGPVFGDGDRGTPGAVNDWLTPVPVVEDKTVLRANHPNPFNPKTSFNFTLKQNENVSLVVFDIRGRLIRSVFEGQLAAGVYDRIYSWDGRDDRGRMATSGTYFYRLKTESGFIDSGKMTLLK